MSNSDKQKQSVDTLPRENLLKEFNKNVNCDLESILEEDDDAAAVKKEETNISSEPSQGVEDVVDVDKIEAENENKTNSSKPTIFTPPSQGVTPTAKNSSKSKGKGAPPVPTNSTTKSGGVRVVNINQIKLPKSRLEVFSEEKEINEKDKDDNNLNGENNNGPRMSFCFVPDGRRSKKHLQKDVNIVKNNTNCIETIKEELPQQLVLEHNENSELTKENSNQSDKLSHVSANSNLVKSEPSHVSSCGPSYLSRYCFVIFFYSFWTVC